MSGGSPDSPEPRGRKDAEVSVRPTLPSEINSKFSDTDLADIEQARRDETQKQYDSFNLYSKTLITLAGGGLALSISLTTSIISKEQNVQSVETLKWGWISYSICILVTLLSYWMGARHHKKWGCYWEKNTPEKMFQKVKQGQCTFMVFPGLCSVALQGYVFLQA